MRGLNRDEKNAAVEMLENGTKPSDVSKKFGIPLSTVTTWNKDVRQEKRSHGLPVTSPENKLREIVKEYAKLLNDSEAHITTAATRIMASDISEQDWMNFQMTVSSELKNIVMTVL